MVADVYHVVAPPLPGPLSMQSACLSFLGSTHTPCAADDHWCNDVHGAKFFEHPVPKPLAVTSFYQCDDCEQGIQSAELKATSQFAVPRRVEVPPEETDSLRLPVKHMKVEHYYPVEFMPVWKQNTYMGTAFLLGTGLSFAGCLGLNEVRKSGFFRSGGGGAGGGGSASSSSASS
jgi:hypothetical protein